MSFCGYCGAQMPDDMSFCTECGKPLKKKSHAMDDASVYESVDEQSDNVIKDAHFGDIYPLEQKNYDKWTDDISDSEDVTEELSSDYSENIYDNSSSVIRETNSTEWFISDSNNTNTEQVYNALKAVNERNDKKQKKGAIVPLILTLACVAIALVMLWVKIKPNRVSDQNDSVNTEENSTPVLNSQPVPVTTTSSNSNTTTTTSPSIPVERHQRDGSQVVHHDVYISHCRISVPIYWGWNESSSTVDCARIDVEDGACYAGMDMSVSEEGDYSWFKNSDLRNRVINERLIGNNTDQGLIYSAKDYKTATVDGILCNLSGKFEGLDFDGMMYLVPTKDYKHMVTFLFIQTENTKFMYDDDFLLILDSIEILDGSWKPESTSNSNNTNSSGNSSNNQVDPNLKAFLDSYEAFMDDYVDFMKKYMSDPTNAISMMTEYLEMLEKYEDFAQKADKYDTDKMSDADLNYYLEVMTRIDKKLLSVY